MDIKSKIISKVPSSLKPILKKFYWFIVDMYDKIIGRDEFTPPRSMNFAGDGDYREKGNEFKQYFIDLGGLQRDEKVLDVGCGIGRMAVPLTTYLSDKGEYYGFDIVKEGINWCKAHISNKFPNFHFLHIDIKNQFYNPAGKFKAHNFKFLFNDELFDFIFLTSVFTHMLPLDLENYLSEISRVLKPRGRCLITLFLLNEESKSLIQGGLSTQNFVFDMGGYLTVNKDNPEAAVAYEESIIRELFEKNNLRISDPLKYGSWCGRKNFLSYQDIILASK